LCPLGDASRPGLQGFWVIANLLKSECETANRFLEIAVCLGSQSAARPLLGQREPLLDLRTDVSAQTSPCSGDFSLHFQDAALGNELNQRMPAVLRMVLDPQLPDPQLLLT
jgi:hypothetical protein